MSIATTMKQLRQEKDICQKELAAYLHVSVSTISNYENGVHSPDPVILVRLADFYGVSADYLLGRTQCRYSVSRLNQVISGSYTVGDFRMLLPRLSMADRMMLVWLFRTLDTVRTI